MNKIRIGPKNFPYPLLTTLVGSHVNGNPSFMTVAWVTIVDPNPPTLSLSLLKSGCTLKGIRENGAFSVNIPSTDLVKDVDYCGIFSDRNIDISKTFKVFYGLLRAAPLIEKCPINLECRLIQSIESGRYVLVTGEVLELHVDADYITEGKLDPSRIHPPIYAPDICNYYSSGKVVTKASNVGTKTGEPKHTNSSVKAEISQPYRFF